MNPFDTETEYNPFEHPSEDLAANQYDKSQQQNNDYSSYHQEITYPKEQSPMRAENTDAVKETAFKDPLTGLTVSEKDLADKERALAQREQKILDRERQIADARANGTLSELNAHPRNFPPIFKWYKYYPDEDLPENAISLVKKLLWVQYGGAIVLALNTIGTFIGLAPSVASALASPSTSILFGLVYLFCVIPLGIDLCFFVFYNAISQGKGLKFIAFLVAYAIYFAFFVYLAVGLNDYGSIGWITSIDVVGSNGGIGAYYMVFSIIGTAFICVIGWTWYMCYKYYRDNDFQKKTIGEAAGYAADYAKNHKDEIASIAAEHPDAVMGTAQYAASNIA